MQDPESKTAFYNAAARKLLEFSEELERDDLYRGRGQANT